MITIKGRSGRKKTEKKEKPFLVRFALGLLNFVYYSFLSWTMFLFLNSVFLIPYCYMGGETEDIETYIFMAIVLFIFMTILFFVYKRPFINIFDFMFYQDVYKKPMGFYVVMIFITMPVVEIFQKILGRTDWVAVVGVLFSYIISKYIFVLVGGFYLAVRRYFELGKYVGERGEH